MDNQISDAELIALLNRAGISPSFYEGEVGETNLPIWRKLAEVFKDYYDYKNAGTGQSSVLQS